VGKYRHYFRRNKRKGKKIYEINNKFAKKPMNKGIETKKQRIRQTFDSVKKKIVIYC